MKRGCIPNNDESNGAKVLCKLEAAFGVWRPEATHQWAWKLPMVQWCPAVWYCAGWADQRLNLDPEPCPGCGGWMLVWCRDCQSLLGAELQARQLSAQSNLSWLELDPGEGPYQAGGSVDRTCSNLITWWHHNVNHHLGITWACLCYDGRYLAHDLWSTQPHKQLEHHELQIGSLVSSGGFHSSVHWQLFWPDWPAMLQHCMNLRHESADSMSSAPSTPHPRHLAGAWLVDWSQQARRLHGLSASKRPARCTIACAAFATSPADLVSPMTENPETPCCPDFQGARNWTQLVGNPSSLPVQLAKFLHIMKYDSIIMIIQKEEVPVAKWNPGLTFQGSDLQFSRSLKQMPRNHFSKIFRPSFLGRLINTSITGGKSAQTTDTMQISTNASTTSIVKACEHMSKEQHRPAWRRQRTLRCHRSDARDKIQNTHF